MKVDLFFAVRVVTGLTLLFLSIGALENHGNIRWLALVEIAAALVFCLPNIWRAGGVILLAILLIAFTHHAVTGQFVSSLLFAALIIVLSLTYERS
jgi:hypothetical protein